MPASTKKRPPLEMEPGEGKAHEMSESSSEEVREGSEADEKQSSHSRKRSAKGSKNTKAPMDAEGGCCNEKKGKGKCPTCAAGGACRGDAALTPHEYLAACELGIQDRSRTYIRARLDADQRLDLKCGKGSISEGEKCHVGAAAKVQPKKYKQGNVQVNVKAAKRLRTASRVVSAIGAVAPLAGIASKGATGMVAGFGAARTAFSAASALNTYAKAQETGSKAGRARLQKEAKEKAISAGGQLVSSAAGTAVMAATARGQRRRQTLERIYRGPSAKRDSIYAEGFYPELDQLAI